MSNPDRYLYVLRPTRPAMLVEGPDARERAIVDEHFAWLQRLMAEGIVLMAGRTDDGEHTFGIVLLRAGSEAAARTLMDADPAVAQGVMGAELHAFRVALWSNAGA